MNPFHGSAPRRVAWLIVSLAGAVAGVLFAFIRSPLLLAPRGWADFDPWLSSPGTYWPWPIAGLVLVAALFYFAQLFRTSNRSAGAALDGRVVFASGANSRGSSGQNVKWSARGKVPRSDRTSGMTKMKLRRPCFCSHDPRFQLARDEHDNSYGIVPLARREIPLRKVGINIS